MKYMTNITIIDRKFKSGSASWSEFISSDKFISLGYNLCSEFTIIIDNDV